jgi:hypothetical protein
VAGLDTLYTYVSNSWSYVQGGPTAIRDACGTAYLSPFEGNPVAIRYRDPAGFQGRSAWILAPLYYFAGRHREDLSEMVSRLVDWLFMVE